MPQHAHAVGGGIVRLNAPLLMTAAQNDDHRLARALKAPGIAKNIRGGVEIGRFGGKLRSAGVHHLGGAGTSDTLNLPRRGGCLMRLGADTDDRRPGSPCLEATAWRIRHSSSSGRASTASLAAPAPGDFEAHPTYEGGKRDCTRIGAQTPRGNSERSSSHKMVDTCAAEFAAETPYFYATTDVSAIPGASRRSGRSFRGSDPSASGRHRA